MTRYRITQDDMVGHVETDPKDYDLLQVIMVRLGKPSEVADGSLLHLLDIAFSDEIKLSEKIMTMADMYGIPMTETFGEELNVMCNWGEGIWERAVKETTDKLTEQMNKENELKDQTLAMDMYRDHMSLELIAKYIRKPPEVIRGWLGLEPVNA